LIIEHISFDDYCRKYRLTGFLLSGDRLKKPAKSLNAHQLRTHYNIHIRKLSRITHKKMKSPSDITKDQILRQECQKRDTNRCRLMEILNFAELRELRDNAIPLLLRKLDCAHVFGKNAYPKMRFFVDNVVLINRVSHNWLDAGKSPINGKPITVKEKRYWWERILGKKMYDKLLAMSKEGVDTDEE
jgi:hypothetical protein